MATEQTLTVRGEAELAARTGHLFADVRDEFVCAATDLNTWSSPDARGAMTVRMRPVFAAGLTVRKLYAPGALADDEQRAHLLEIAAAGAQVRVTPAALPHETIIVDRRAMILAGRRVQGDREFTVTTVRTLIDGVHALFRAAWDTAPALGDYLRQDLPQIDAAGRTILRELASGRTDEAAARHLGLSLRTYRRRVAGLMRLLESESRFQAGAHAAERGLTR